MKYLSVAIAGIGLFPVLNPAASFSETLERLSAENPEFVAYADFQEDFEAAGSFLTDAYLAYLMTGPEIPPIPVDFKRLFEHMGLSSLQSAMAVSEARPGGGFENQMLMEFSEAPRGIFLLMGETNQPFTIGQTAPADAGLIMEMNLNGVALYSIIRSLVIDIMGPMGEEMIDAQMNNPILPEGPTLAEIISRLTTRIEMAAKPDMPNGGPEMSVLALIQGKAAIRIANLADLLDSLSPFLQQAGFVPSAGTDPTQYTLTVPVEGQPMTISMGPVQGSNDLLIAFNEGSADWFLQNESPISSNEEFRSETAGLPTEGLSFWYSSKAFAEMQVRQLDAQTAANEKLLPIVTALKSLLMNYTGAQAGVSFLDGNAYRVVSYQPTSYKTNLALAGAVIPVSFASTFAAMAKANAGEEEAPAPAETPSPTE